ncbi:hypothetical protein QTN94_18465 [Vibrio sp. M250220]|uniref:hypothetical protein n=1 Tax=Vibrio sp. M250220 TaxID=3020894 RepID=UPI002F42C4C4
MSWIMDIFRNFFGRQNSTKRDYPMLKMVNPDRVVMDMKAFRKSKAAQEQAKAAREGYLKDNKVQA